MEGSAKEVDSGIVAFMVCVTANLMCKVLQSKSTVVV